MLADLLASPAAPPRGRVAVPGCGRGHDLRLLLDHGYDAIGFDFAHVEPGLPVERLDVLELGNRYPAAFDAVFEYTCYCAIDPSRRPEYARALRDSLKPGGLLIALLFPVERRDDGPPFGIGEHEIQSVLGEGMQLISVGDPASSVEPRRGRERLALLRKPARNGQASTSTTPSRTRTG